MNHGFDWNSVPKGKLQVRGVLAFCEIVMSTEWITAVFTERGGVTSKTAFAQGAGAEASDGGKDFPVSPWNFRGPTFRVDFQIAF